MNNKNESKFNLDSFLGSTQKIIYITMGVSILVGIIVANYTSALLSPIKHDQKHTNQSLNKINIEIDKLDNSVDDNTHDIGIINTKIRNIN